VTSRPTHFTFTHEEVESIMGALLHNPTPLRKEIWERMDKVLAGAEARAARNAAPDCPGGVPIQKSAKQSAVCSLCGWRDLQHPGGSTMRPHKAPASWKGEEK
jgi:hypothetical protein